jgi:tetratricopeptide (TPR) repeat protein
MVSADRVPPAAIADWRELSELVGELCEAGGVAVALDVAEEAVAAGPEDGNLRVLLGQALAAAGRRTEALAALSQAMRLGTEVEVLDILARITFPGPSYRDNLAWLHRVLAPSCYLEIGVFKGETLRLARPGTIAIGVDPAPLPQAEQAYEADTTLHRLTSDRYFAQLAVGDLALPAPVGLAFIDGLHLYEQVLRDFIHVERYCTRDSVVVLHDTLPVAPQAASRPRQTSYWCGDVWKMLPCLRRFRPDLSLLTIPCHPSGLTIVTGLDPQSAVLADLFDAAVDTFMDAVPALPDPGANGDVANDPALIRAWLAASPAAARIRAGG